MIVTSSLDSIDLVLGANVATNQLHINASYNRLSPTSITPVKNCTTSSNTSAVNIVPAPSSGNQHQLKYCNIFNTDSTRATVTVRTNYNGTTRNAISTTLQVNEYLQYTPKTGWKAFDVNGSLKTTFSYNSISEMKMPEYTLTTTTGTSAALGTTTYCVYLGKSPVRANQIIVNYILTTAAVTVTWAEMAIYKGVPVIGSGTTLTRAGFIDVSVVWTNITGQTIKNAAIPVTGVDAGDDIWLVVGNSASTSGQLRVFTVADNIGAGFIQTAGSSRPSLSSSLSTSVSTTLSQPIVFYTAL